MVSLEILLTCFVIRMVRLFILAVTGAKILQMVVVKKIMKTGSKTYEVTYNLYFYNWMTKKTMVYGNIQNIFKKSQ